MPEMMKEITLEQVDQFFRFMQGEMPEGIVGTPLKMTPAAAFSVIWYLQEVLEVIPDNYEQCDECGELFDAHRDGYLLSEDVVDRFRAHWATNRNYCDDWCLTREIARQREILFRDFD